MERNVNIDSLLEKSDSISGDMSSIVNPLITLDNQDDMQQDVNIQNSLLDATNVTQVIDNSNRESKIAERKKFFMNPINQAEILMQNYLLSHPDLILTGKQKRTLRREFITGAKKGKYNKIFKAVAENLPSEQTKETFDKLNS